MIGNVLHMLLFIPVFVAAVWIAWLAMTNQLGQGAEPVRRGGICAGCGYPISGLKDLRCPECGDRGKNPGTIYPIRPKERVRRCCWQLSGWFFGVWIASAIASHSALLLGLPYVPHALMIVGVIVLLFGMVQIIRREVREKQLLERAAHRRPAPQSDKAD